MLTRTLTGVVFVAVLVGCIIWSPYSLGILFFVISMVGLHEFYRLSKKASARPQLGIGLFTGAVIYAGAVLPIHGVIDYKWLLLALPLMVIAFILELYRMHQNPFTNLAFMVMGWLYVVMPFAFFNYFWEYDSGTDQKYIWYLALGYFILIWTNDTFAYLAGRTFGKHKLFERISPKKTWEGTMGGVIASMGAAALMWYLTDYMNLWHWMAIAFIIVVFGSLGDLVESMFKRSIDIKDSGNILPGHGGILDRFDGVLISAPVVFAYLVMVVNA